MNQVFLQYVAPALLGLFAGAIGSLVAPWVTWGIEKRKMKLQARREFLLYARNAVREIDDRNVYREHVTYSQLRPFLSQRSIELIESDARTVQIGGRGSGVGNYKALVYDD